MSHYTVGYHDNYNGLHEICEYADDAFHAIKQAEDGIRDFCLSRGLGDVYKRQLLKILYVFPMSDHYLTLYMG